MTRCCHLSRREILAWGAVVAASPFLSGLADPERAYGLTRQAIASGYTAYNLELVTLTETSAVVTWVTGDPTRPDAVGRPAPVPADTEVLLGTTAGALRTVVHDDVLTPYHYVEITDLEPGQTYVFTARSGGIPATPTVSAFGSPLGTSVGSAGASGPFVFTTPQPPPGRFLFSLALCNDLHLGETVAGLATTQAGLELPPGIRQVDGEPPYPEIMARALADEARARGAARILVAGDVTSEASSVDSLTAKSFLDRYGALGTDYHVARGNHDRPHTGGDRGSCHAVPDADGYHDCFRDAFFPTSQFPDQVSWFSREVGGLRLLGLDTYDKIGTGGDNGIMSAPQLDFVRQTLAAAPDQPTIVFGHHPVSLESSITTLEPLIFDLDQTQARQLEALYATSPGVFLHHAAHTHRNKRTLSTGAPNVVFQEVAAVKEYPGGFHLLRVFTGGYALNFYKFRSPLAQEWSERSRPEYGGLIPFYTFGNTADRNSVAAVDLSDLTVPATPTPAVPELGLLGVAGSRPRRPEERRSWRGGDSPPRRYGRPARPTATSVVTRTASRFTLRSCSK